MAQPASSIYSTEGAAPQVIRTETRPQQPQQQVPMQQQPQQKVIVVPEIPRVIRAGRFPCIQPCPACKKQVSTRVVFSSSSHTWIIVGGLCFVGCVPCCVIPLCMDACKKCDHFCTICNTFITSKDVF